jgi:hypothetical protein
LDKRLVGGKAGRLASEEARRKSLWQLEVRGWRQKSFLI